MNKFIKYRRNYFKEHDEENGMMKRVEEGSIVEWKKEENLLNDGWRVDVYLQRKEFELGNKEFSNSTSKE